MSEASSLCWLTNIQTTSLQMVNHLAEIRTDNLQTTNKMLIKIFTRNYIFYDMECVVNKRLNFFANGKHCENIFRRVFTTIKQLVCNFINNAYHTRRRFISLLTIIQTTSLQMINHIKSSQQLVNNINKNNIFANSLLRFNQTIYKQQTRC